MRSRSAGAALFVAAALAVPSLAWASPTVVIKGGGFGHGIGMSQYGAYGYALHGFSAKRILTHYYQGAELTNVRNRKIRVGLLPGFGSSQRKISLSSASPPFKPDGGKLRLYVQGDRTHAIARGDTGTSFTVKAASTGGMLVYRNGDKVKVDGVTVFGDQGHALELEYERYGSLVHVDGKDPNYAYGRMELSTYPTSRCRGGFCIRLVAVMPLQRYLYGLGEMPSSWPQAALKSQAIAGRTYAVERMKDIGNHRDPCDCTVYDSTIDQAYIGDDKRLQGSWSDWKRAVDRTSGDILEYGGRPIQALYSSSSGGHTENNENVWGGAKVPYLRGVPDPYDGISANPYHTWKVRMTWSEFAARLESRYRIGTLKSVKLRKPFGVSGRVTVVKSRRRGGARISGTTGSVTDSGWNLKGVLGLRDTLFRIHLVYDIGARFQQRYSFLQGAPGAARSDPYPVPKGTRRTLGEAQDFRHGRMTWTAPDGPVTWQHGAILHRYDSTGREKGPLGMPRSGVWGPGRYLAARYAHGIITWSDATGAEVVKRAWFRAYRRFGTVKGELGLPRTGPRGGDSLPNHGKAQRFTTGTLYLNPHRDAVYGLWGDIATRYRQMGEATSSCGYPIADQVHDSPGATATFRHGTIVKTSGGTAVHCG